MYYNSFLIIVLISLYISVEAIFRLCICCILFACCKKKNRPWHEQAADIPVQMKRGQNDEPEVHNIGLDQEQQTHKIEDEVIPSDDNVYLIDQL